MSEVLIAPRPSTQALEDLHVEAKRRLEALRQDMIYRIRSDLRASGDRAAANVRQALEQAQTYND